MVLYLISLALILHLFTLGFHFLRINVDRKISWVQYLSGILRLAWSDTFQLFSLIWIVSVYYCVKLFCWSGVLGFVGGSSYWLNCICRVHDKALVDFCAHLLMDYISARAQSHICLDMSWGTVIQLHLNLNVLLQPTFVLVKFALNGVFKNVIIIST